MTLNPHLKLILDIIPLAGFFATYKLFDLFTATGVLLVLTVAAVGFIYAVEKRIAIAPVVTAVIVSIFGGLAIMLHNEIFIKIKPTLVNLVFAFILLGGCYMKKGLLKPVLGTAFTLSEEGWYKLSLRWGIFFLLMAALNEFVWRNFPTSIWVDFKVFGLIGLTLVFAVFQTALIAKHQLDESQK